MPIKNDDAAADLLIKEVDEELRQEQLQTLWKRHGRLIIGGAVAVVLAVAGWQGWNAWQTGQRQQASTRFAEATRMLEQGQRDKALDILAGLAASGPAGYRLLAELKLGELKQEVGDSAAAAALYEKVAASEVDPVYRDLATLKAAYLRLDDGDPAGIEKAVERLAVEASPWRHSAREILALAALKRGDTAKAAELFRKVADDPAAPQGVRGRAAEMLAAVGGKANG